MAEFRNLKVLVVDDDLNIRKIIKAVLHSLGVRDITEATNGQEAFELLKFPRSTTAGEGRRKYDLVISDWAMPYVSGAELLERIRNDTFLRGTHFVMATAESERENILKAIGEGVDDYVVKPFTAKSLEDSLRRVADKIK